MFQILQAIKYIHSVDVVHRDLKPENIMLTGEGDHLVRIIDFGSATWLKDGQSVQKISGTSSYMAPEIVTGDYDKRCDIWSCGVLFYKLIFYKRVKLSSSHVRMSAANQGPFP